MNKIKLTYWHIIVSTLLTEERQYLLTKKTFDGDQNKETNGGKKKNNMAEHMKQNHLESGQVIHKVRQAAMCSS